MSEEKMTIPELIERINALIEEYHQGSVQLVEFDGETLKVRLGGACSDCPNSMWTLAMSIGRAAHEICPTIKTVEAVD